MARARLLLAALLAAGCGGPVLPARTAAPEDPTPLAKCQIAASQTSPLVTEWSAAEKARLEGLLTQGGVAVRYSGCEMTLLDGCRMEGDYRFQRTTLSTDVLEIRDEDELYAKLPLGAVSLEGELGRTGRLAIRTTVSGQQVFRGPLDRPPAGMCAGATHVITAISIGAFKMVSGRSIAGGGSVGVGGERVGGSAGSAEEALRQAGDPQRCVEATESSPHPECGSPIQVFLAPLPAPSWQPPAAAPPGAAPQPWAPPAQPWVPPPQQAQPWASPAQPWAPPARPWVPPTPTWVPPSQQARPAPEQQGPVHVRVPAALEGTWTLRERGGPPICQLPCGAPLERSRRYVLQREGEDPVALPSLAHFRGTHAEVDIKPARGSRALGITGIAVGGAAVFGGLILFVATAREEGILPGMLLSTGGLGLTAGGIAYTVYSRPDPKATLRDSEPGTAASSPRVQIVPGGVIGAF